jgi:glucokinase
LSQIGLVRQLGLGQATVSVAVGELLAQELIVSIGHDTSTGGRRAERLALNPTRPLTLGFDLGEADAQLGVVNMQGHLLEVRRVGLRRSRRRVQLEPLVAAARDAAQRWPHVRGLGVAVPGIVSAADGLVRNAANLGWRDLPIAEEFAAGVGLPVVVDRNANAAVLGEEWWGKADGDPFVFVTLGSGVGAGLRVNHTFLHGASETAGEFGHIVIEPGGSVCQCGRRGCLETRASAGALVELDQRLRSRSGRRSARRSVADIAAAALAGEPAAAEAVGEVADWLGAGLITLITLLNPRVLMLGGELMAAQELLLPRIRELVRAHGQRIAKDVVEIVPSTFGDQAVVVGAGALAFERLFRTS